MDTIKTKLDRAAQDLQVILAQNAAELARTPEGRLNGYSKGGHRYYTQVFDTDGGRNLKGINRKPDLIRQLAGKECLLAIKEAGEWNALLLQELMEKYQSMDLRDLIAGMKDAPRSLPKEVLLSARQPAGLADPDKARSERMERLRQWARAPFEQSTYKPEEKIHLTSTGIYVRSKSEASISEKLFDYNVGNRYEQILWLEGKPFAPDFTLLDAAGQPFYWEHAGMMHIPKYARHHQYKMDVFERHGIVPWKNLIVTYDTEDGGINMGLIDSIVRFQILPRL